MVHGKCNIYQFIKSIIQTKLYVVVDYMKLCCSIIFFPLFPRTRFCPGLWPVRLLVGWEVMIFACVGQQNDVGDDHATCLFGCVQ